MDHVGPFITTELKNKYILVLVDNFTKFVVLYAVENTGTGALLDRVKLFVNDYGLPRRFITDRGSCFTSKLFEEYFRGQGVQLVLTSSRHPRANGQVERVHSVVMAALMTEGCDVNKWDLELSKVQRCINNSESKVTSKTCFELLHGYRPRFQLGALRELSQTAEGWTKPKDLWEEAREQMEESKRKSKSAFDKNRHDNIKYTVGEVVVMKRAPTSTGESTKLQDRYRGPLVVTEVLPGDVYRVTDLVASKKSSFATTAHVMQLKSWKLHEEEEPELREDDENDQEVDGVVSDRPVRKRQPPCWAKDYVE